MNDWMRARNGWTILLMSWGLTLTSGLLGAAMSRMFFEHHPASVTSNLPWLVGGSLLVALCGTVGALRRRRRQG
ncbi:hypothetical protein G3I60_20970 [Streptomyces sp. SID13666]|uniref:hypothetical protein n=1 Tax=unclassified Streptomyces TaxID=2593676 RepID=UPI0013C13A7B|nr:MULTISPECIES: hypothetical protein [unclassified Streptomyces]NEA56543.1 hypothetical protein [Streptomyces sp. SID13666]NEA72337.1 hypothetical protein [Streptomyces sp. SID13588]